MAPLFCKYKRKAMSPSESGESELRLESSKMRGRLKEEQIVR